MWAGKPVAIAKSNGRIAFLPVSHGRYLLGIFPGGKSPGAVYVGLGSAGQLSCPEGFDGLSDRASSDQIHRNMGCLKHGERLGADMACQYCLGAQPGDRLSRLDAGALRGIRLGLVIVGRKGHIFCVHEQKVSSTSEPGIHRTVQCRCLSSYNDFHSMLLLGGSGGERPLAGPATTAPMAERAMSASATGHRKIGLAQLAGHIGGQDIFDIAA